jgi:hypothetical protein
VDLKFESTSLKVGKTIMSRLSKNWCMRPVVIENSCSMTVLIQNEMEL